MRKRPRTNSEHRAAMLGEQRTSLRAYRVEPTPPEQIERRRREIEIERMATMPRKQTEHYEGRSAWTGSFTFDLADFCHDADNIKHMLTGSFDFVEGDDWNASGERDAKDTVAVGNAVRKLYKDIEQYPYKVIVRNGGPQDPSKSKQRTVSFSLRKLSEAEIAKLTEQDEDEQQQSEEAEATAAK